LGFKGNRRATENSILDIARYNNISNFEKNNESSVAQVGAKKVA
jgi:hypothetical protein